ncbi:hypothetical protein ABD83_04590 [Bacillus xiamenensis]|nr:hypothetical protein BA1_10861 [Bacillus xiamenensis]MBG9910741.1 hypothetical protein [Bacillus xiamenensis]
MAALLFYIEKQERKKVCAVEEGKGFFPNALSCIYIFRVAREEGKYTHSFVRIISKYFIIGLLTTYKQDFYI